MARIDFCKKHLVYRERTGIPLFWYSFSISWGMHFQCSPLKKALLCWRTSAMDGEAVVSHKGQGQVMLWRVIRNLLRAAYFIGEAAEHELRVECWHRDPSGCKADSCITFFLQREILCKSWKSQCVGRLSSYQLKNSLDLVAWDNNKFLDTSINSRSGPLVNLICCCD